MSITGTLGARLYVSATPLADIEASADAITDFQGLTIDQEVGFIENFGEIGKVFDLVTFQAVADGRTTKLKGASNEGQMSLVVGLDLTNAGQAILKTAAEAANQDTLPFKLTFNGADASFDTAYFGGKVMSFRTQMGAVNSVIKAAVTIEVNTQSFTGAS